MAEEVKHEDFELSSHIELSSHNAHTLRELLASGADHFDPVGFRFIEALARRCLSLHDASHGLLQRKLAQALATYQQRFELAASEARDHLAHIRKHFPEAAGQAADALSQGDFSSVRRLRQQWDHRAGLTGLKALTLSFQSLPPPTDDDSLAALSFEAVLSRQEQTALAATGAASIATPNATLNAPQELKTIQLFKSTWAKLSTEKRVNRVIDQAPKDAGPLNSQTLVIRSLAMLRELSPEYLSRFVTFTDTLLWLDKANSRPEPSTEKPAGAKTKSKNPAKESPGKKEISGKTETTGKKGRTKKTDKGNAP